MKEKLGEKIDKFMNKMLSIPPTLEELSANFPHKGGCVTNKQPKRFEREEMVHEPSLDPRVPGLNLKLVRKYLECDNCHIKARFVE